MKNLAGIISIIVLLGLNGCASSEKSTTEPSLAFTDVMQHVRERDDKIHTLSGKGSITIETPEASNSGSFRVRLKKPDSLIVEIRGPFGVRVATLALSREQFLFYDWGENRAIVGKPEEQTLRQMLHLAMSFEEIIGAFTGVFPRNDSADTMQQFVTGNDAYKIYFRSVTGSKEYIIDGETFIIKEYSAKEDSAGILMTASASDFTDDTLPLPQFLRVVFPREKRSVTITYTDVLVNEPVSCAFEIPKQAEIIYR